MLFDSDITHLRHIFQSRLEQMLAPDQLGAFILVLANSMQDQNLRKSLAEKLEANFITLRARLDANHLKGSADDLMVFEALLKDGINHYSAWQNRTIEHWQCVLNPLRALRPERASKDVFDKLFRPFNDNAFHFDKPFLRPEILSEEVFSVSGIDTKCQIMYHKFPFAPYHLLIVIDAARHKSQYLDENTHHLAWNLTDQVKNSIPGFATSYNSLGAGASVNHLHIHGFVDPTLLAIEQPEWIHNGGNKTYPLSCRRFDKPESSWQWILQLHQTNQPYNILYRPGLCYVISRQPQGLAILPEWLASVGWYEACGGFNLSHEDIFQSLTPDDILQGLSLLSPLN